MTHQFPKNQLLNITTGRLYTEITDIHNFFYQVTGRVGLDALLPCAQAAILPLLKVKLDLPFDDIYEPEIEGKESEQISFEFSERDRKHFWLNYKKEIADRYPHLVESIPDYIPSASI